MLLSVYYEKDVYIYGKVLLVEISQTLFSFFKLLNIKDDLASFNALTYQKICTKIKTKQISTIIFT